MTTKSEIKARLDRLQRAAEIAGNPTPEEVGRAQRYYHENGGQWPPDASPQTIELAEALIAASEAMADIV